MPRVVLLALAVALVLADSSVVTLGLPSILGDLNTTPEAVSWVLTAYNLVLAIAAVPAAMLVRRTSPSAVAAGGLALFAAASLICAVAPSIGVLIGARCIQGLGGAAVACAALPLLSAAARSPGAGAAIWGLSGAVGAAVGPALGGILTEAFAWEAIFAAQVPVALVCLLGCVPSRATRETTAAPILGKDPLPDSHPARGPLWSRAAGWRDEAEHRFVREEPRFERPSEEPSPAEPSPEQPSPEEPSPVETLDREEVSEAPAGTLSRVPEVRSLVALGFLGAGLTAALFLLVLLLIAGWRHSPMVAALTVSVMPVASLFAARAGRGLDPLTRGACGAILVAGGLAALAILPGSSPAWTIAPQVLIGLGLGLSLAALTESALIGRTPQVTHGAYAIAARHAGVVVALAVLTPIFVADLDHQEDRAEESIVAAILDSPIQPSTKLDLGTELANVLDRADGEVPDTAPAFASTNPDPKDAAAYAELRGRVDDELDRAAKAAFTRSFLFGALLSLGALVPLLLPKGRQT